MIYYFIAGMLFTSFISPILDSIASLVITAIEVLKSKCGFKITTYNHQMDLINNTKECQSHVIGFAIPTEEDDEDEDEIL